MLSAETTHKKLPQHKPISKIYKKYKKESLVAIKKVRDIVSQTFINHQQFDARLYMNQATFLSVCYHPHIVKYYSSYVENSTFCLEMQYIHGGDLTKTRLNGNYQKLYKWIYQIANALLYLHERGIIHRDIKLANLMVDSDETIRVIDFGISVFKWCIPMEENQFVGTPCYMAPQLIMRRKYDQKIDVYALGVCVYQLAYDRTPFQGETKQQYWQNSLKGNIDFPQTCPQELIFLMEKMLQRSPSKRISVAQILDDPSIKPSFQISPTSVVNS